MMNLKSQIIDELQSHVNEKSGKNSNPFLFMRNTTFSQQQINIARKLIADLNGLPDDQALLKGLQIALWSAAVNSSTTAENFISDRWTYMSLMACKIDDLLVLKDQNYDESFSIRYDQCVASLEPGDLLRDKVLLPSEIDDWMIVTTLGKLLIERFKQLKGEANNSRADMEPGDIEMQDYTL